MNGPTYGARPISNHQPLRPLIVMPAYGQCEPGDEGRDRINDERDQDEEIDFTGDR